jgi:hypothetical protein
VLDCSSTLILDRRGTYMALDQNTVLKDVTVVERHAATTNEANAELGRPEAKQTLLEMRESHFDWQAHGLATPTIADDGSITFSASQSKPNVVAGVAGAATEGSIGTVVGGLSGALVGDVLADVVGGAIGGEVLGPVGGAIGAAGGLAYGIYQGFYSDSTYVFQSQWEAGHILIEDIGRLSMVAIESLSGPPFGISTEASEHGKAGGCFRHRVDAHDSAICCTGKQRFYAIAEARSAAPAKACGGAGAYPEC